MKESQYGEPSRVRLGSMEFQGIVQMRACYVPGARRRRAQEGAASLENPWSTKRKEDQGFERRRSKIISLFGEGIVRLALAGLCSGTQVRAQSERAAVLCSTTVYPAATWGAFLAEMALMNLL